MKIFYITNDPERGLGPELIFDNYKIICIDHNTLVDQLAEKCFSLEKELKQKNIIFRSAEKCLKHELAEQYITSIANGDTVGILVFKPSLEIELYCRSKGWQLLNNSYELSSKCENKFELLNLVKNTDIKIPKSTIQLLSDELPEFAKDYNFVVQFQTGHTGDGTYMITNEKSFENLRDKFPSVQLKLSEKVEGIPMNVNGCIVGEKIYIAGLNQQLVDSSKILAKSTAVTVGNNYNFKDILQDSQKDELIATAKKIGEVLKSQGYKGLYGIDTIVNSSGVYLIEINARQTGNVSYFNQLQIRNNEIPMSVLHLYSFASEAFELNLPDEDIYMENNNRSELKSQIFIRNYQKKALLISYDESYLKHLLDELEISYDKMILAGFGRSVSAGQEFLRLEFGYNMTNSNGAIEKDLLRKLKSLKMKLLEETV